MTTATPRATARSPEQVCDLLAVYTAAGDVDGLLSLYEPSARLVLPSGRQASGPAELRAACAESCSGAADGTVGTGEVRRVGELALLTRTCTATAMRCRPLVVRRQPDGRWLAVIDDLSVSAS